MRTARRVGPGEQLLRADRLSVLIEIKHLVGQVHRQVVTVLGQGYRLVDGIAVVGGVRITLVWSRLRESRQSASKRSRPASYAADDAWFISGIGRRYHFPTMYVSTPGLQSPDLTVSAGLAPLAFQKKPITASSGPRHAVPRVNPAGSQQTSTSAEHQPFM